MDGWMDGWLPEWCEDEVRLTVSGDKTLLSSGGTGGGQAISSTQGVEIVNIETWCVIFNDFYIILLHKPFLRGLVSVSLAMTSSSSSLSCKPDDICGLVSILLQKYSSFG